MWLFNPLTTVVACNFRRNPMGHRWPNRRKRVNAWILLFKIFWVPQHACRVANPFWGNDANCHGDGAVGISDLKMEKQNKVRTNVRQLSLGDETLFINDRYTYYIYMPFSFRRSSAYVPTYSHPRDIHLNSSFPTWYSINHVSSFVTCHCYNKSITLTRVPSIMYSCMLTENEMLFRLRWNTAAK